MLNWFRTKATLVADNKTLRAKIRHRDKLHKLELATSERRCDILLDLLDRVRTDAQRATAEDLVRIKNLREQ